MLELLYMYFYPDLSEELTKTAFLRAADVWLVGHPGCCSVLVLTG